MGELLEEMVTLRKCGQLILSLAHTPSISLPSDDDNRARVLELLNKKLTHYAERVEKPITTSISKELVGLDAAYKLLLVTKLLSLGEIRPLEVAHEILGRAGSLDIEVYINAVEVIDSYTRR